MKKKKKRQYMKSSFDFVNLNFVLYKSYFLIDTVVSYCIYEL